ncbi:MAG: uncharacterized protein JWL72_4106 [Ilumatobacteraceae bacterium]|nr:uncharacterized protein [Ilumatobacteraceae bacterium]
MELAGTEVPIVWRGRRASAFVPTSLAERNLELSIATLERTVRARADVEHAAEGMPEDFAALARLLLRSEGVASSYIEGIVAPVIDVVLAEQNAAGSQSPGSWIAANLAAVSEALDTAHAGPLSADLLRRWHRTLMTGSPTPSRFVGRFRNEQGWIGGTSPLDAHLVTPPPSFVEALIDDLIVFVDRTDVDPVAQAAISHAQFELIHPFGDGNGRVGRILIAWILTRRLALVTPPPVSTLIAADVGGYAAGLTTFRFGDHDRWVRWFADAVSGAGRKQLSLVAEVGRLRRSWRDRLPARRDDGRRLRSDATAWRVLELLPRLLVLTARQVASALDVPDKTAHAALSELVDAGILVAVTGTGTGRAGRPAHVYASMELLGLAGATPLRR